MQEKIFLALMGAYHAHFAASRKQFAKLDLTEGQPKILYFLHHGCEGALQKELAQYVGITPATLTSVLDKMTAKGYIRKEETRVSGGKRGFRIFLSEEGAVAARKVDSMIEELEEKAMKGFTEEERKSVLALLTRLENNLSED